MHASAPQSRRLTPVQWLICLIASIGFAFDIYELLMMPLIATPALSDLLGVPADSPLVTQWIGIINWVSAFCGGVFGLLGGWLIDRFGRKKILLASILIYGFSPVMAAMSTSVTELMIFRCTTFIGVCVEFVAAVAWLAELFPDPKQRETVLGVTQAFSSFGGLMVTGASVLCRKYALELPALPVAVPFDGHAFWRYTLITGLIPALPTLLLLPFLPESPVWKAKSAAGTLKRPSFFELFAPQFRRTTITSTILFACCYAAAFARSNSRLPSFLAACRNWPASARCSSRCRTSRKRSTSGFSRPRRPKMRRHWPRPAQDWAANRKLVAPALALFEEVKDRMQFWQETGGLLGRIALALLAVMIVSRRTLLRIFLVPGLLLLPLTFGYFAFQSEPHSLWPGPLHIRNHRPVQLLGQLPAGGVSGPSARNRRRFRRERRRPHDRHVCVAANYGRRGSAHAGCDAVCSRGLCGRGGRRSGFPDCLYHQLLPAGTSVRGG